VLMKLRQAPSKRFARASLGRKLIQNIGFRERRIISPPGGVKMPIPMAARFAETLLLVLWVRIPQGARMSLVGVVVVM
jgi:hypothetical protein